MILCMSSYPEVSTDATIPDPAPDSCPLPPVLPTQGSHRHTPSSSTCYLVPSLPRSQFGSAYSSSKSLQRPLFIAAMTAPIRLRAEPSPGFRLNTEVAYLKHLPILAVVFRNYTVWAAGVGRTVKGVQGVVLLCRRWVITQNLDSGRLANVRLGVS